MNRVIIMDLSQLEGGQNIILPTNDIIIVSDFSKSEISDAVGFARNFLIEGDFLSCEYNFYNDNIKPIGFFGACRLFKDNIVNNWKIDCCSVTLNLSQSRVPKIEAWN